MLLYLLNGFLRDVVFRLGSFNWPANKIPSLQLQRGARRCLVISDFVSAV
jgi:hypothetical protein